jgi:hypothetical protein
MIGLLNSPFAWSGATVAPPSAPTISAIAPTGGLVGTVVTVFGTNLATATRVQIGTTDCAFTVSGATLLVTIPDSATTAALSVTTAGGFVTGPVFTVVIPAAVAPTVTAIAPGFGPVGTTVTLTGTSFGGTTQVALGSVAVPFAVVNATTITVTIPADAADGAFRVTTPAGIGVSARIFAVSRPTSAVANRTLVWALEVFPANQPTSGLGRVLLRSSRNAIVVRDVIDKESDGYQDPDSVTWRLLEGADAAAEGSLTPVGDGWRGEVILDPTITLGPGPVLRITATLAGASWVRDYPVTISAQG